MPTSNTNSFQTWITSTLDKNYSMLEKFIPIQEWYELCKEDELYCKYTADKLVLAWVIKTAYDKLIKYEATHQVQYRTVMYLGLEEVQWKGHDSMTIQSRGVMIYHCRKLPFVLNILRMPKTKHKLVTIFQQAFLHTIKRKSSIWATQTTKS